jgi:hypothetical protein
VRPHVRGIRIEERVPGATDASNARGYSTASPGHTYRVLMPSACLRLADAQAQLRPREEPQAQDEAEAGTAARMLSRSRLECIPHLTVCLMSVNQPLHFGVGMQAATRLYTPPDSTVPNPRIRP